MAKNLTASISPEYVALLRFVAERRMEKTGETLSADEAVMYCIKSAAGRQAAWDRDAAKDPDEKKVYVSRNHALDEIRAQLKALGSNPPKAATKRTTTATVKAPVKMAAKVATAPKAKGPKAPLAVPRLPYEQFKALSPEQQAAYKAAYKAQFEDRKATPKMQSAKDLQQEVAAKRAADRQSRKVVEEPEVEEPTKGRVTVRKASEKPQWQQVAEQKAAALGF